MLISDGDLHGVGTACKETPNAGQASRAAQRSLIEKGFASAGITSFCKHANPPSMTPAFQAEMGVSAGLIWAEYKLFPVPG